MVSIVGWVEERHEVKPALKSNLQTVFVLYRNNYGLCTVFGGYNEIPKPKEDILNDYLSLFSMEMWCYEL